MCKFVQQQKQPILLCGNRTQALLRLIDNVRNDLSTDFRNKGKNFWEVNLINLKLTIKTRISETGKGPSINWTRVICWRTPTVFWMSRGPFFLVAECTWELTLCSLKYTQQNYLCLSPVPLWLRWQLKSLEDVNHQYQIPAELIQAEGRKLHSEIHILIWNNEELPQQWNKLINEPVYKKADMTDCTITEAYQH